MVCIRPAEVTGRKIIVTTQYILAANTQHLIDSVAYWFPEYKDAYLCHGVSSFRFDWMLKHGFGVASAELYRQALPLMGDVAHAAAMVTEALDALNMTREKVAPHRVPAASTMLKTVDENIIELSDMINEIRSSLRAIPVFSTTGKTDAYSHYKFNSVLIDQYITPEVIAADKYEVKTLPEMLARLESSVSDYLLALDRYPMLRYCKTNTPEELVTSYMHMIDSAEVTHTNTKEFQNEASNHIWG